LKAITLGLSIYGNSESPWVEQQIKRAQSLGLRYIFTSLHIPEEHHDLKASLNHLLTLAHAAGLKVIADISPITLKNLELSQCTELVALGVGWWRVDYGFDFNELLALSKRTPVMLNASLLDETLLRSLQNKGIPQDHLAACHNFYPKPYSGLALERVREQNRLCHHYGLPVFGFIAGDGIKRGPIEKGLPTVEESRWQRPLVAALQLIYDAECDHVLVGDPDCTSESWQELGLLAQHTLQLQAELLPGWEHYYDYLQQEREDSSPYVIRSQTSRQYAQMGENLAPIPNAPLERMQGSIWIANHLYRRYSGELEIARRALPLDPWQNYIGQVANQDLELLPFVQQGMYYSLRKLT
jgi:hypothetical protein